MEIKHTIAKPNVGLSNNHYIFFFSSTTDILTIRDTSKEQPSLKWAKTDKERHKYDRMRNISKHEGTTPEFSKKDANAIA